MTVTEEPTDVDLSNPESVGKAVAGEQPDITPPEDPIVELPRGIFHEGAWQKKVELHELTGEDEERFTRFKDEELFVQILVSGIDRIGSISMDDKPASEQEQIVQSLLVGEQMMLLVNIIRVTFGNEREFKWKCLSCEADNTTTLLISEDFQPTIPEGINGEHVFVDSKNRKISYVPVSGVFLAELKPGMSQGAAASKLLEKVIGEIDGDIPFDIASEVKAMGLKDRRELLAEIDKAQPVVNMTLDILCPVCGEEQSSALTWAELFRI